MKSTTVCHRAGCWRARVQTLAAWVPVMAIPEIEDEDILYPEPAA